MNKSKGFISIWIIVYIIAAFGIVGGATYAVKHKANNSANQPETNKKVESSGDPHENRTDEAVVGENNDTQASIAIDESGVHVTSTATISGSQGDGWFYVPELHVRFKNVEGFTPKYSTYIINPKVSSDIGVNFTSEEIVSLGKKDTGFAGCMVSPFGVTTVAGMEGTIGAWQVAVLSNGKYLDQSGHQDSCFMLGKINESTLKSYSEQAGLFQIFIKSAQSYSIIPDHTAPNQDLIDQIKADKMKNKQ